MTTNTETTSLILVRAERADKPTTINLRRREKGTSDIRYTNADFKVLDSKGKKIWLPVALKVHFEELKNKRYHIYILEGVHKGQHVNFTSEGTSSYLTFDIPVIRYLSEIDYSATEIAKGRKGWINVRYQNNKTEYLPSFLKVRLDKVADNRDYFTVIEGADGWKGVKASIGHTSKGSLLDTQSKQILEPAALILDLSERTISFGDLSIPAFTQVVNHGSNIANPIPNGEYYIQIPDQLRNKTDPNTRRLHAAMSYLKYSPYSTTWFRLKDVSGKDTVLDRYIHLGQISHGCATIGISNMEGDNEGYDETATKTLNSYKNWTKVFNYLIKRRLINWKESSIAWEGPVYIGKLTVINGKK